jgi:hypothetical protein
MGTLADLLILELESAGNDANQSVTSVPSFLTNSFKIENS